MSYRIELIPEMVKLAQQRSRITGGNVRQEIARQVVLETIIAADPELNLMIDEEASYSHDDSLVAACDVNDIVINGRRFDIRVLQEDGKISLARHLLCPAYMSIGSLAVRMNADRTAEIAGFVSSTDWMRQDEQVIEGNNISLRVNTRDGLNLLEILSGSQSQTYTGAPPLPPSPEELKQFIADKMSLPVSQQRFIVSGLLLNCQAWPELKEILSAWSKRTIRNTLTQASIWNSRLEAITGQVAGRFQKLSPPEIRQIIAQVGSAYGGQPQSPQFKQEMLKQLTRAQLAKNLSGDILKRAAHLVEQVLSGSVSSVDAVRQQVSSTVAVDLALAINKQRNRINSFIDATAEEITFALQQLALQPVYATHSKEQGIEELNTALFLLEAGELAKQIKELEAELG